MFPHCHYGVYTCGRFHILYPSLLVALLERRSIQALTSSYNYVARIITRFLSCNRRRVYDQAADTYAIAAISVWLQSLGR